MFGSNIVWGGHRPVCPLPPALVCAYDHTNSWRDPRLPGCYRSGDEHCSILKVCDYHLHGPVFVYYYFVISLNHLSSNASNIVTQIMYPIAENNANWSPYFPCALARPCRHLLELSTAPPTPDACDSGLGSPLDAFSQLMTAGRRVSRSCNVS